MLIPVILSGGAGTRLWPVSREAFPKPFMTLPDGENLLQKTLRRAMNISGVTQALTVTNRNHYFQSRDAYADLGLPVSDWLLEPIGRNTAAAIACAALHCTATYGEDAILLVLPADHLIEDQDAFELAVNKAVLLAKKDRLVTFGISPIRPETGFGYIKMGDSLGEEGYSITQFVEKPNAEVAQSYIASGQYVWNSGMFCFQAKTVLAEFERHTPELFSQAQKCYTESVSEEKPTTLSDRLFSELPDISFDYAVMEHTEKAAVVQGNFDWNDIGSWQAIANLGLADAFGNRSDAESLIIDSNNCYLRSEDRFIAAVGVDNLLVIDTADALLVAHRDRAQDVKQIAVQLKQKNHPLYRLHRTVHRPWGSYTVLEEGERFKIKRLVVKSGASLSSQLHYHRNEHWIVVSGTARISNGDVNRLLLTNQSTYIEAGTVHRLENPGLTDLVMIEVQSGEYLGEDDIVRFEDIYGRQ